MRMLQEFDKSSVMPVDAAELLAWHARPGAFERLNPPWDPVEVMWRQGGIGPGDRTQLRLGPRFFPVSWVAEHRALAEGTGFADVQVKGPFTSWEHRHLIRSADTETTNSNSVKTSSADIQSSILEDRITYQLPLGAIGQGVGGALVRRQLERVFSYRHRLTADDLALHASFSSQPRRRVLMTGASGLIGRALAPLLSTGGHQVVRLGRAGGGQGEVQWDPAKGILDPAVFDDINAVVHLSGTNVGAGRWTAGRKAEILDSRIDSTRLMVRQLARLKRPPEVLVCASASGYYGSGGAEWYDEDDPAGQGFLAEVCRRWEQEALQAEHLGIRLVLARIGVVLSPAGGALARMVPFFRCGLGGRIGRGDQYMSWIALDDVVGALYQVLMDDRVQGPVNMVAPHPVTNAEFVATLGQVLGRPASMPVPAAGVRLLWGEMGRAILLDGIRVRPTRLTQSAYSFRLPRLADALRFYLGKAVL
jgi:uncharacterized protein